MLKNQGLRGLLRKGLERCASDAPSVAVRYQIVGGEQSSLERGRNLSKQAINLAALFMLGYGEYRHADLFTAVICFPFMTTQQSARNVLLFCSPN